MTEMQEERRDALFFLNEATREMVLRNQYDLPFVKLLAIDGAKQSDLELHSSE